MNKFNVVYLFNVLFLIGCSSTHYRSPDSQTNAKQVHPSMHTKTETRNSDKSHGSHDKKPHSEHWSYSGKTGPQHWGKLEPQYSVCEKGHFQSPINLKWKKPEHQRKIEIKYNPSALRVIDNGHTIQANFDSGSYSVIEGKRYDLLQMHFHSRSEHALSGQTFPLELHLVHKDPDSGKLAVLGVFFKPGKKHPALDALWAHIPPEKNKEWLVKYKQLNPQDFLPQILTHYHYVGSLTTPPCTEGVSWNVLNTPLEASMEQIALFRKFYNANYRPLQNIGDRRPANYQ